MKAKASRKSAVARPSQVGLAFHVEQWIKEKAKTQATEPGLLVNMILNEVRVSESERCNPPFNPKACAKVAIWEGHDGTWERLLIDTRSHVFYLEWSWSEPADVTLSEALHWYGCKRALECVYGNLDWSGLEYLISAAASELQEWERVQKVNGAECHKEPESAADVFSGKAGAL